MRDTPKARAREDVATFLDYLGSLLERLAARLYRWADRLDP